jgi:uncharacterized protein (DUF2141 family)
VRERGLIVLRFLPAVAALLLATFPALAAGDMATLTIRVEKISPQGGDLRVALYDKASYPNDDSEPVKGAVVPAVPPETVVVLDGIPPGTYAVKLFQDFNRNGKFDMTWLGMPIEKYGFSNDVRPFFTEPGFDRTKIKLSPGANSIIIHLQ